MAGGQADGCKNLSRIEKIGSRKIRALDWDGLELVTAQEVGDEIEAVGIRAHDFEPLSSGEALEWKKREDANLIPVEDAEISEMPFEWYVTMKNHLWWKQLRRRSMCMKVPDWCRNI